ncbi:MAG: hypothetical protein LBD99_06645 [Candidatus Margulisbacteria bacterium]|jgi:hypothetical protein|nr:hypothetical protein [Candidatus Margulisiibacteriota bacterium]
MPSIKKSLDCAVLIIITALLSSCGKVSNNVLSAGGQNQPAFENNPSFSETAPEISGFIRSLKYIMQNGEQLTDPAGLAVDQSSNVTHSANNSFGASSGGFAAQAINFEDDFPHWNYTSNASQLGDMTQSFEHKFRYHKPNGTYIEKKAEQFTAVDWEAYDYIEDLQIVTIKQSEKTILTLWYHNKVYYDKASKTYTYELMDDSDYAQAVYVYYVYPDTQIPVLMKITDFNATAGNSGSNATIGLAADNSTCTLEINAPAGGTATYAGTFYNAGQKMAELSYRAAAGENILTKYFIGEGYGYASLSQIYRGLEDNSIIELHGAEYANVNINGADGLPANGGRLKNIRLQAAPATAKLTGSLRFNKIDGLYLDNSLIIGTLDCNFGDCTEVQNNTIARLDGAGTELIISSVYSPVKNYTFDNYKHISIPENVELSGGQIVNVNNNGDNGLDIAANSRLDKVAIENIHSETDRGISFASGTDYLLRDLTIRNISGPAFGIYINNIQPGIDGLNIKGVNSADIGISIANGTLNNAVLENIQGTRFGVVFYGGAIKNTIINNITSDSNKDTEAALAIAGSAGNFENVTFNNLVNTQGAGLKSRVKYNAFKNVSFLNIKNIYLPKETNFQGTITFTKCSFSGAWSPEKNGFTGGYDANGDYTGSKTY